MPTVIHDLRASIYGLEAMLIDCRYRAASIRDACGRYPAAQDAMSALIAEIAVCLLKTKDAVAQVPGWPLREADHER
jgi:hypothetical protein